MRKKLGVLIGVTLILVLGVLSIVWVLCCRNHTETDWLIVDWHETGTPLSVEGYVHDEKGIPICGQDVTIFGEDGFLSDRTDACGHFAVEMGTVKGIGIYGAGIVKWGNFDFGGISSDKGIRFDITVKPDGRSPPWRGSALAGSYGHIMAFQYQEQRNSLMGRQ
jgi:hypothetical protein